jgi:hypothetical protein
LRRRSRRRPRARWSRGHCQEITWCYAVDERGCQHGAGGGEMATAQPAIATARSRRRDSSNIERGHLDPAAPAVYLGVAIVVGAPCRRCHHQRWLLPGAYATDRLVAERARHRIGGEWQQGKWEGEGINGITSRSGASRCGGGGRRVPDVETEEKMEGESGIWGRTDGGEWTTPDWGGADD